jgi:hypothetical protein
MLRALLRLAGLRQLAEDVQPPLLWEAESLPARRHSDSRVTPGPRRVYSVDR